MDSCEYRFILKEFRKDLQLSSKFLVSHGIILYPIKGFGNFRIHTCSPVPDENNILDYLIWQEGTGG